MGWPEGWSDTAPLAMDKYHLWQQRLYGALHTLIKLQIEEGE